MQIYDKERCLAYYQSKYNYMDYEDIELLFDIAIDILVNLKYPFKTINDKLIKEAQKQHPTWCLRCMQVQIDKSGISNLVGYSENGVSMTFDKSGLPQYLIDEVTSQALIV